MPAEEEKWNPRKSMKFTINSHAPAAGYPPVVARAIEHLKKLEDGELKTLRALAADSGLVWATLQNHSMSIPPEFWARQPMRKIYGNQKTIKAWKEQSAVQD